ncbi:hypothetical protein ACLKA6_005490 [Drosophila palustris]
MEQAEAIGAASANLVLLFLLTGQQRRPFATTPTPTLTLTALLLATETSASASYQGQSCSFLPETARLLH